MRFRIILLFLIILPGCITQFTPQTNEDKKLLVVEGLITDQPVANIIKLSRSLPLGTRSASDPVTGSSVTISDNSGNTFNLKESDPGTYVTDPSTFVATVGRQYTLHIKTNSSQGNHSYDSYPVEMLYVPSIDSVYYEKKILSTSTAFVERNGCQVYLDTHDPTNQCKFYRWEYSETWEFRLPYNEKIVPNNRCWISNNSESINVKSTSLLSENSIKRYPVNFISNETDRLSEKYSIEVNQYSLNEEEFNYWEKLQNLSEQTGGLYDKTPSAVPSNIFCIDDPGQSIVGYFSVSAVSSKRIFIKDHFAGLINLYTSCNGDTIFGGAYIPDLNKNVWIIIEHPIPPPNYTIITYEKGCADCTVRGTKTEPEYWNGNK
jgi:hypothetical protein